MYLISSLSQTADDLRIHLFPSIIVSLNVISQIADTGMKALLRQPIYIDIKPGLDQLGFRISVIRA